MNTSLNVAQAQQQGIRRIDLQRHDLGVPGHEIVRARVELDPGVLSGKHWHPGEEIIYVLEGSLEYQVEGQRRLVNPGRNYPRGEERRQRQRGGARHLCRRKREAARRGIVTRPSTDSLGVQLVAGSKAPFRST